MDFGTLITILILVGSFIYSIIKNAKQHSENRPGQEPPKEREQRDPFEDLFPDPFEDQQKRQQPHEEEAPRPATDTPSPKEPEKFSPVDEYQDPFAGDDNNGSPYTGYENQPYQRPADQPYERDQSKPFKRKQKQAYARKHKKAYKRKKAQKQGYSQRQKKLSKSLQNFDPVQAVIYSDILNRPKYLEDAPPPPFDRRDY